MNKNKILNILNYCGLPLFIIIGAVFKIENVLFYAIVFLIFGIFSRILNKKFFIVNFLYWIIGILLVPNIDLIYFSLVSLCLGNLVGFLFTNLDKEKEQKPIKRKSKVKKDDSKLSLNPIKDKFKKYSFLFPIFSFIFVELLFYLFNSKTYFSLSFTSILFSLFVIYLIYSLLLGITKTTFRANVTMFGFMIFYFFINQFKIYFTGDSISATEIIMVTEAGELAEIIKAELFNSIMYYRRMIIILIISVIIIIRYIKHFNYKIENKKIRLSLLSSLIVIVLLVIPIESRDRFITKYIFNNKSITKSASINNHYGAYRMIGGLYVDYLATIDYSESVLNDQDLKKIYDSTEYENPKKVFKKPNIVLMLTEAFWDITKQNSIKFNTDPLKEYHDVKKNSIVINTLSPTFGGKSSNTEFELITGGSLSYYRMGTLAYFKYFQRDESNNNPTIIRELKNNGYKTYVGIAETAKTYAVDNIYTRMNFDIKNEWYEKLGYTVKDDYLIGDVIKTLKEKPKDEKIFYMTVSMDSHMPFIYNRYKSFDFDITNKNLSEPSYKMLMAYTQAARNASLQLKRIYDYIQTLDEDTIVIFLGDHLPILSSFNVNSYNDIAEFNTSDEIKNLYTKYNTETLIISNYDIDYTDLTDMSTNLILTTVLNQMDVDISDYYKWLYSTRKTLPAVNAFVAKDLNGNLYSTSNLSVDMQKTYNLRSKVQKYLFK